MYWITMICSTDCMDSIFKIYSNPCFTLKSINEDLVIRCIYMIK